MSEKNIRPKKRKGVGTILRELSPNEKAVFPRTSYNNVRSSISILKIEYPDREFYYNIIEGGIEAVCVK